MQSTAIFIILISLGIFFEKSNGWSKYNQFHDDHDEEDVKLVDSSKFAKLHFGKMVKSQADEIILDEKEELLKRVEKLEAKLAEKEYSQPQNKGLSVENRADKRTKKLRRVDSFMKTEPAEYHKSQGGNLKPVAFTVQHSKDPVIDVNDGDVIKFDQVLTTTDDGYETASGVFTSPVYGYYQFYVSVMCTQGKYVELLLKVNGKSIGSAYASGSKWKWYDVGSTLSVVYLKQGDKVWVEKCCGHDQFRGKGHSQFTGFLLKQVPERMKLGPT